VMNISPDEDPAVAALIELVACVVRGETAVNDRRGHEVVVMVPGPIGVMHMMVAKARGAGRVLVSEPLEFRRIQALELGADSVVDPINEDLFSVVQEISEGRGANVIIVAAPSKIAQESALQIATVSGRINLFGGLPKDDSFISFDSNIVHYKELVVTGTTACSTYDCLQAADLVRSGRIDLGKLVTKRFALSEIKKAFAAAEDGTNLRVSLIP